MGYYGRSSLRGDYYRGDYFKRPTAGAGGGGIMRMPARRFNPAGDFWDDAADVFGKVVGYVPSVVAKTATGFSDALTRQLFGTPQHPALNAPQVGGGGVQLSPLQLPSPQIVTPGGAVRGKVKSGKTGNEYELLGMGGGGRSRRMNPTNTKALRRALRRSAAFLNVAKHYVKVMKPGSHVSMRDKPTKKHHK